MLALTPLQLDALREVLDHQIKVAEEWQRDEPTNEKHGADLRRLWALRQLSVFTADELADCRAWVQSHLTDFIAEWVGDSPENAEYLAMRERAAALLAALGV